MRYWILLVPALSFADVNTTDNLLNQNFDSNAWSGTATGRHGSYEIAANHGQYLESTISLSNTLTEDQIKYGWTSTLGADIWHWNNATSETEMIQTITASDGTVTTQSRKVTISGCGYTNCGSHQTYTDSHTEGMNGNTDYDIKVRFNFSESTQSPYHWAVDLENPTLVVEYEPNPVFLSNTQTAQISTAVDNVEEIELEEYKFEEVKIEEVKIEEFKVEQFEEPEFNLVRFVEEEIVTGILNIFEEPKYEEPKAIETFTAEVESFEEENINNETTSEGIEEIEEELIANSGRETGIESNESSNPGGGETETISETNDEERLGEAESNVASNGERNGGAQEESQVQTSAEDMGNDTQDEGGVSISVSDIQEKVAETIKQVDKQLAVTSLIVAKAMQSGVSVDKYGQINNNILNQPNIDGGDYFETRDYTDTRVIYAQNQNIYSDIMGSRQEQIEQAADEVIRAEEHLRRIRGY